MKNSTTNLKTIQDELDDLILVATDVGLCFIGSEARWEKMKQQKFKGSEMIEDNQKMSVYADQLKEYLNADRQTFNLPLDPHGTPFQLSVWKALKEILYGETCTYTDVAERIERPEAVRAVASAIGRNPVLIVIPCHRVIRKNGDLSGFREDVQMKGALLKLEKG